MTSPEGPFYSTLDADSEGEEGKFFVWTPTEIEQILGTEDAELFGAVYGVDRTEATGKADTNILHRVKTFDAVRRHAATMQRSELRGRLDGVPPQAVRGARADASGRAATRRSLTAWNGLMIGAFAQAAQVLDDADYADAAGERGRLHPHDECARRMAGCCAPTVAGSRAEAERAISKTTPSCSMAWSRCTRRRSSRAGSTAALRPGRGDDRAILGRGGRRLLLHRPRSRSADRPRQGSARQRHAVRQLDGRHRPVAAGEADRAHADLQDKAETTLRLYRGLLGSHPLAAGQMLIALDFHLGPVQEIAIVGDPAAEDTRRVLRIIRGSFQPNRVVALKAPTSPQDQQGTDKSLEEMLPLLAGKTAQGPVTMYLCQNFTCQAPLVGVQAIETALTSLRQQEGKSGD